MATTKHCSGHAQAITLTQNEVPEGYTWVQIYMLHKYFLASSGILVSLWRSRCVGVENGTY